MKWKKIGPQKYEAVSITGRNYVAHKASMYLWRLTVDGERESESTGLKLVKSRAEVLDVEHQKKVLN